MPWTISIAALGSATAQCRRSWVTPSPVAVSSVCEVGTGTGYTSRRDDDVLPAPATTTVPVRIESLPTGVPVALVALGGAVGTGARHLAVMVDWHPASTVTVLNVVGSALLGALVAWRTGPSGDDPVRADPVLALTAVGFCGGLTTFSTHALDVAQRLDQRLWMDATTALLGPAGLCVAAAGVAHQSVRLAASTNDRGTSP
jgi:CrcB protein